MVSLGPLAKRRTYIVQLDKATVPARGEGRSARRTPSARSWRADLAADQRVTRRAMGDLLGRQPTVTRSWTEALNGFSVELTGRQAERVATLPGVTAVTVDETFTPEALANGTDEISADHLWTGAASSGLVAKGEGMVVGVIDSGINPANPSFATTVSEADGGDGYVVVNPLGQGKYLGMCDPSNTAQYLATYRCTDKLIGAWDFSSTAETTRYDNSGHGSHTASIAAGNQVLATWPGTDVLPTSNATTDPDSGLTTTISGVAPHANLISYDVCAEDCSTSDIVAAWNQAITDGVDVINYSIGSTSLSAVTSPWRHPIARAQLSARAAGISVAQSAGNNGTSAGSANTITNTGDTPWVTSVANTSHSLGSTAGSVSFTTAAGGNAYLGPFSTATISDSLPSATQVVLAVQVGKTVNGVAPDGTCLRGSLDPVLAAGKVVLCARGGSDRVAKGRAVKDAGGAGMVLVNASATETQLRDIHVLPTAHITLAQGNALKSAMNTLPGLKASIVGGGFTTNASASDVLNATSSRGPTRNQTYGLGPMVSAPGTDVLAAGGTNNASQYAVLSGTSMASPAVAGSMALLKQVHPTWTDAQVTSALMTTATTAVKDRDGTAATWFEMGSGRIDVARASRAGLLLDVPTEAWTAADPALGGDLEEVNTAQLSDGTCPTTCELSRTFTATAGGLGTWTAGVTSNDAAATFSLDRSSFTMDAVGQAESVQVTAVLTSTDTRANFTGTLTLTPPVGSDAPTAHLPIAVRPVGSSLSLRAVATQRGAGTLAGSAALAFPADEGAWTASEPDEPQRETFSMAQDATPDDPYDAGSGVVRTISVPSGTKALAVTIENTTATDLDLYVGTGATATAASLKCQSATEGSAEECVITRPPAGQWWILAQGFQASAAGTDDVTMATTLVTATSPASHLSVAPSGPIKAVGKSQPISLSWDAPVAAVGESRFTVVGVEHEGVVTETVVTLRQYAADVQVADLPETVRPGETVSPRVTVRPDVLGTGAIHTVSIAVPNGASISGVTAGGRIDNQTAGTTITWVGTHSELAQAAGVAATEPVTLTFDTVVRTAREGDLWRATTVESVDTEGSRPTTSTAGVRVAGGAWPSTSALKLTSTSSGSTTARVTVTGTSLRTPSGTVQVLVDGTLRGTARLTGGVATLTLPTVAAGSHRVIARYAGDASNTASASGAATWAVAKKQVSITAKPRAAVRVRKTGTLLVTVKAAGVKPRGRVTITVKGAGRNLTQKVLVPASGVVKMALGTYRKVGTVKVTVAYAGDANTKARTLKTSFKVKK